MPLSATRRGQGRAAAGGRARAALALGLFLAAARPPRLAGEDAPLPGSPLAGGPRGVLGGWPGGSLGAARSPFGPGGAAGPGGPAASLGSAAAGQVEGGDPGAQIEAVGSGAGAAGSGGAKEASFLDDPSLGGRLHLTYRADYLAKFFHYRPYQFNFPDITLDDIRSAAEL